MRHCTKYSNTASLSAIKRTLPCNIVLAGRTGEHLLEFLCHINRYPSRPHDMRSSNWQMENISEGWITTSDSLNSPYEQYCHEWHDVSYEFSGSCWNNIFINTVFVKGLPKMHAKVLIYFFKYTRIMQIQIQIFIKSKSFTQIEWYRIKSRTKQIF